MPLADGPSNIPHQLGVNQLALVLFGSVDIESNVLQSLEISVFTSYRITRLQDYTTVHFLRQLSPLASLTAFSRTAKASDTLETF